MRDNRGQSLVELLIAFAISTIVLAGLSYLLFTGIRLYDRNDVSMRVQNEAQNAMNLMTDHMMEAGGVCMEAVSAGSGTQCILLDGLVISTSAGGYDAYFAGEALIVQIEEDDGTPVGEIYLVSFPNQDYAGDYTEGGVAYSRLASGEATEEAAAQAARREALGYIVDMPVADRRMWLMADHVTGLEIAPADSVSLEMNTIHYEDGTSEVQYFYQEPFGFVIRLTVNMQSQTGGSERTAEETVYTRNRLRGVYIEEGGSVHQYERK